MGGWERHMAHVAERRDEEIECEGRSIYALKAPGTIIGASESQNEGMRPHNLTDLGYRCWHTDGGHRPRVRSRSRVLTLLRSTARVRKAAGDVRCM